MNVVPPAARCVAAISYDRANRPTAMGNLQAGYTAEGLRAWKVSLPEERASGGGKPASAPQPGLTYFLYDGETLLMEMDSLGNATAVNTWGPNGLVSRRTASGSVWYRFDERGCTVQRTNHLGQVVDSYQTDPYIGLGAQWGYYRDPETGLQLCTYRYYDPLEGRWLTQDPIGMAGGLNLYGYVGGNPVGWVDPLGLWYTPVLGGWEFTWAGLGEALATLGAALGSTLTDLASDLFNRTTPGLAYELATGRKAVAGWDGGRFRDRPGFAGSKLSWSVAEACIEGAHGLNVLHRRTAHYGTFVRYQNAGGGGFNWRIGPGWGRRVWSADVHPWGKPLAPWWKWPHIDAPRRRHWPWKRP